MTRPAWLAVALVVAAWISVLALTNGLRPAAPSWLSSHTMAALRGYEAWGLAATAGANVLLPLAPETAGADLRALTKPQGLYLSYPTLWSLLLYAIHAGLGHPAREAFVEGTGELVTLLGGALASGWLTHALVALAWPATASGPWRLLPALLAALAWLTSAPVLYFGRHEVFADQLVVPVCLAATALAVQARFRLTGLSPRERAGLAACGLLAWGTEYLGWLTMGVLAGGFAWRSWRLKEPADPGAWVVLAGPAVLAVGLFSVQLFLFEAAWQDLTTTFLARSVSRTADNGVVLTGALASGAMASHLASALPGGLRELTEPWGRALLGQGGLPVTAVLALLATGLLAHAGLRLGRRTEDPEAWRLSLLALWAPAVLHSALLLQHACVHRFTAVKYVAPWALTLVALPLARALLASGPRLRWATAAGTLGLVAAWLAMAPAAALALRPPHNTLPGDLARLVQAQVGPGEIPIAQGLAFDTINPQPVWLAQRLVYSPEQLAAMLGALDPGQLARLTPVVLVEADSPDRARFEPWAAGRWRQVPQRITGRPVLVARLPALQGQVGPWVRSLVEARAGSPNAPQRLQ